MAAGTAALAIGSTVFQAKNQMDASRLRARAARRNAFALDEQARETLRRSKVNDEIKKREGRKFIGRQVSAFSRGGIDVGTGSPLEVLAETQAQIDRERLEDRIQAQAEARSIRAGASNLRSEARAERASAPFRTVGTLLGGFSQAANALR